MPKANWLRFERRPLQARGQRALRREEYLKAALIKHWLLASSFVAVLVYDVHAAITDEADIYLAKKLLGGFLLGLKLAYECWYTVATYRTSAEAHAHIRARRASTRAC